MLPIGHTMHVFSAQFSPDGKKIVTASPDNTAKIWDAVTGNILADLRGHTGPLGAAQFSPDGKKIVTASFDHTAKIWDAGTGKLLIDLQGHKDTVYSAQFSPDGKKIVTASYDHTAKIWDAGTGELLASLTGHRATVLSALFSPDGNNIVTASFDSSAKIWDAGTGKFLTTLKNKASLHSAQFSPDGKKIVTASADSVVKIWDTGTGKLLADLKGHRFEVASAQFSPDGKMIVSASWDLTTKIWDAISGKLLVNIQEHRDVAKFWDDMEEDDVPSSFAWFSHDGKRIVTVSMDSTAKVWDPMTGKLLIALRGHTDLIRFAQFSEDGKKIVTASDDGTAIIWDAASGNSLAHLKGHSFMFTAAWFSPVSPDDPNGGKSILTVAVDSTAKIWDAMTGKLLVNLKGLHNIINSAQFSRDGKKIATASDDSTVKIWDAMTGKLLTSLKKHRTSLNAAQFSPDAKRIVTADDDGKAIIWNAITGNPWVMLIEKGNEGSINSVQYSLDGKKIITGDDDGSAMIWDAVTGKPLKKIKGHGAPIVSVQFSPDGKKIVTTSLDSTARIWDPVTGKLLHILKGHTHWVVSAQFDSAGTKIITGSADNTAKIWDAVSGAFLFDLKGHTHFVMTAQFSPDGKKIVTASSDNTCKIWNAETGEVLYTFFALDNDDYLVVDKNSRYDGTDAARKLLYFTCGLEVIGLDQVKDQLWVPNLAERINNGETINAKSLNELDICDLTPLVEEVNGNPDEYYFTIKPRRGGLGDISLSINGAVADTRKPEQLTKNGDFYEFRIIKNEFIPYLPDGQMNTISLKAYTADNTISSRVSTISIDKTEKPAPPPNLYAVMVGVSDYKGDGMDLDFAAIDATDVSSALKDAAGKLLGKEHVFMYNLTTAKDHDLLPEKNSIKKVLEEIGQKATANDILFIFLSGHGVMEGEGKKLFYYMTADAADFDAYAVAGISTTELTEWIKPQNIKAQKRILILDACHSGQAINDFVKLGDGIPAAKGDEKGQQIKAIDKLNEKSGLFILSASASDKSAFESQRHSHGYLTYSLLKAIKEQPDILEDGKFLNISRWFNAAGKTVSDVSKEEGVMQETQIVTNTDFNIGLVDDEVTGKIKLSEGKQLFSASNFQNSDIIISDDDLDLGKLINAELGTLSLKGAESKIMFIPNANSPEAFRLSGRYLVKGNSVTVTVNIRQNKIIKKSFALIGTKDKLEEMAGNIVKKVAEWVGAIK